MATLRELRDMAFSLPETMEEPHFEKTSFRIKGTIFATYDQKNGTACLKLSPDDQSIFSSANGKIIYPVGNSWGKKGWTIVELQHVKKESLSELVTAAYMEASRKKKPKPPFKPVRKKSKGGL